VGRPIQEFSGAEVKQNRIANDIRRAFRHVAEAEVRVACQEELIARLKRRHRPSEQAEGALHTMKNSLLQLRNHLELMRELMKG
jgi:hypothetical protein